MSEIISTKNLDDICKTNNEIKDKIIAQARKFQTNPKVINITSAPQQAFSILQRYGLIQMPIEDKYFSGAIYIKEGKIIPYINTALPRANQYFTAWHEIYHLYFDNLSTNHFIETNNSLQERKAEYFAGHMLLRGVDRYFNELPKMDFVEKIFYCMSTFQAPYKAVLISLYEYAIKSENKKLRKRIKEVFDYTFDDLPNRFMNLGLDDYLVKPSYVINTSSLQEKIKMKKKNNPDLNYHKENEEHMLNIISEIKMRTKKK